MRSTRASEGDLGTRPDDHEGRRAVFTATLDCVELSPAKPGHWVRPARLTVHWKDGVVQGDDEIFAGMSDNSQQRIIGKVAYPACLADVGKNTSED